MRLLMIVLQPDLMERFREPKLHSCSMCSSLNRKIPGEHIGVFLVEHYEMRVWPTFISIDLLGRL